MYFHEQTYDLDELFTQNLHIHTTFSGCAKPEMTVYEIISEAEKSGLKTIALTDHIQGYEDEKLKTIIPVLRDTVSLCNTDIEVLIGAELSAFGIDKYNLKDEDYALDYYLYSHNHYHVDVCWEQPEKRDPESYRKHCEDVMKSVIKSGKPDCMAHPFIDRYLVKMIEGEYKGVNKCVTQLWKDSEIGDMLELGKKHAVAWELNVGAIFGDEEFSRRYFNIGREVGVIFNAGTDAHRLCNIDTKQYLPDLKKILY